MEPDLQPQIEPADSATNGTAPAAPAADGTIAAPATPGPDAESAAYDSLVEGSAAADSVPAGSAAADPIAVERDLARDQITAAWQIHVELVREQLEIGWREHVERILSTRLAALAAAAAGQSEALAAARLAESIDRERAHAVRLVTERLNQSSRRLDQAEDSAQWATALLDGAQAFAPNLILLSCLNSGLNYEGHRFQPSFQPASAIEDLRLPPDSVPAINGVGESLDTVIAMATPGELSQPLINALALEPSLRVCLVPVLVGRTTSSRRPAAILMAWGGEQPLDVNVLELLCSIAAAAIEARFERRKATTAAPPGEIVNIAPALISDLPETAVVPVPPPPPPAPAQPDFASLSREQQEIHSRAQRFARVRVAEMRLYQPEQVRQGREQARLYMTLRGEMDRSRAQFKHEFLAEPTMIDYFHKEITQTLANDDESLLGVEYPGPLL